MKKIYFLLELTSNYARLESGNFSGRNMIQSKVLLIILFFSFPVFADEVNNFTLDQKKKFKEAVLNSKYIAKCKLKNIKESAISKQIISVNAGIEVVKILKGEIPQKFDTSFVVLPESIGINRFKTTPKDGEYVIFFIEKEVKDSKGNLGKVILFYEPNLLSIAESSSELENQIQQILK